MTGEAARQASGVPLVPGELRGYRQFELRPDGLYPVVQSTTGPWSGTRQRAQCAAGRGHPPPAKECRCGLYGWYLPGSATVSLGPANAVIAARGRCVLGDRGFRAAEARIEAVALPAHVRWYPPAASRARRMLAERYPDTRVYGSARRMLKDHPAHDVHALGVHPPPDRSRGYRAALVALCVAAPLLAAVLAALTRLAGVDPQNWWALVVVAAVAWQAGIALLMARLLALQAPG